MSNQTATQFHTWVPEPLVRGTFSILLSCLFTLVLCVWTAVHLNIPECKKESEQKWRKMKWLVVALLAPEMVALIAFFQRTVADDIGAVARSAFKQPGPPKWHEFKVLDAVSSSLASTLRKLLSTYQAIRDKYQKIWGQVESSRDHELLQGTNFDEDEDDDTDGAQHSSSQQRHPWTPTHSFFAAMGGFAFDTRGEKANFLPCNRRRIAITSQGINYLLKYKPSLIPDIPESTIKDKSKGSWITKLITCLQATWFCAQCFARWSQGISVSLLELNTLAHALCTFVIYFFWWNKPLDIDEPIVIYGESMHRVAAFMCLSAWSNRGIRCTGSYVPNIVKRHGTQREHEEEDRLPNNNGTLELCPGQSAYDFTYTGCNSHETCQCKLTLNPVDIRCWQLAREALDSDLVVYRDKMSFGRDQRETYNFIRTGDDSLVGDRSTNDPATFDVLSQLSISTLLASLFYGGIHLVAWNRAFRTTAEAVLWKLSGLGIIAYGVVLASFLHFDHRIRPHIEDIWMLSLFFVITPGFVFYVFCRIYIIIESFLDLFHLPDSAFQVPRWSQYFPHM